jgi:hypothetical protein
MNTKSKLFVIVSLVLIVVASLFVANKKAPVPAAVAAPATQVTSINAVVYDISTKMPVWVLNEDPHYTGPVSKTCIDRTLFQYHNLDKASCGILAAVTKAAKHIVHDVIVTLTPDITTTGTPVITATPELPTSTPEPTLVVNTPDVPATSTPNITTTPDLPTATPDITATPKPTENPTQVATEKPCDNSNPGNLKCKGNSGEDPNGSGTMPQDNTGGNGNGQHGNQGTGGNGNGHNATVTPSPIPVQ